jgi:hypothetical protein
MTRSLLAMIVLGALTQPAPAEPEPEDEAGDPVKPTDPLAQAADATAEVAAVPSATPAADASTPAAAKPSSDDIDLSSLGLEPGAAAFDDKLNIYGFADIGYTVTHASRDPVFFPQDSRSFAVGNLNIYLAKNLDDGIRLDTSQWSRFWSAMVHAVRNAVDHGIEAPELRAVAGKPARPTLSFTASRTPGELVISLSDDGGGINWDRVRERARASGLPADTQSDLERALFADGFSTSTKVSDVSGRGVGMAALRVAVAGLGGKIEIASQPNQGTTLRCRFPEADAQILSLRQPTQPLRTFR